MKEAYKEMQSRDYFNQIIKEMIKDLNKGNVAYCFSREQIDELKISIEKLNSNSKTKLHYKFKDLQITDDEGFFYIKGPVTPSKQSRRKSREAIENR